MGDYKIIFRSEDDTRRFLRAFLEGRAKADELVALDADRLSQRRFAILEGLRGVTEEGGRFEEGC